MTVTLLLFASYADALGVSSLDMELASESTVGELLSAIRARPGADAVAPPSVRLPGVVQRRVDF